MDQVKDVKLPTDLCNDFPRHVVEWLARYDISVGEALKYGWKYSPQRDQLIFIFPTEDGGTFYQARNFRQGNTKYYNVGEKEATLPIFHLETISGNKLLPSCKIVVVEDVVSAARISRQSDSMPCLGSSLPVRKINALKRLKYEQVVVWLDHDKFKEACHISDMFKWLGIGARALYTEKDPKEYTDAEIKEYLR